MSNLQSLDWISESENTSLAGGGMEDGIISKIYIKELLSILHQDTQQIMSLKYQGYTFKEIADKLHMNPATVRSRYSRARATIKDIIGEQNDE